MEEFVQFISTLLASRQQAHIFHWQVQGIVESFQGKYGIQRGYTSPATFKEDGQFVNYFEALAMYVETIRIKIPQDSYIQNEVDTVVKLIQTTKYKLINLK